MDIVRRLLLRDEIDALEHELSTAKASLNPDFARIRELTTEVERLERRFLAARHADIGRQVAGQSKGAPRGVVAPTRRL
jgi:capsule polysaccharide export protein KpsE/RkpR